MVKCPTATPSQLKAYYAHFKKASSFAIEESTEDRSDFEHHHDEEAGTSPGPGEKQRQQGETITQSEATVESEQELDSNIADKRRPPTPRDELIYIFVNCFMDILLERWEGTSCFKPKLKRQEEEDDTEDYGEDYGPCEMSSSSSVDTYLQNLYTKRSASLSKRPQSESRYSVRSNLSDYMKPEDFESIQFPEVRKKTLPDENVYFQFKNGVWYNGRVSRRLMEGEGYFFWNDGTSYQGEFQNGTATGKGRMVFSDLSVYEGEVYKAFRHGEGMFYFSDSPVMYSGQWWLGKKHGRGLVVYNEPRESHNYYKGEWQDGVQEGFGFRQYPSGARYVGYWSNGKRHGRGVMFWSNNDIYRGDWKNGLMHGYGEYTWNGFVNNSLSYPAGNIYRGHWQEGKRNGVGLFEVKTGCLIETVWINDVKEGYGAVICRNGGIVASELLFVRDKPAVFPVLNQEIGITGESPVDCLTSKKKIRSDDTVTDYSSTTKLVKAISIPINAAVHTLNLAPHIQKFFNQRRMIFLQNNEEAEMKRQLRTLTPQNVEVKSAVELTTAQEIHLMQSMAMEESNLRNFIIFNNSALKVGYDYYSKLACEEPPQHKCVLLRLFLWQLLLDGGVPDSNLSLVDMDNLIAKEEFLLVQDAHDPFEKIQFWQFIQILILLSWHLYGQYVHEEDPLVEDERVETFLQRFNNCETNNVFKTAIQFFIEGIFWDKFLEGAPPPWKGRKFQEYDFFPLDPMYRIYCNVGKPHSATDFIRVVCQEPESCLPNFRYFEKLPLCKAEGRNVITVAGELQHLSTCDSFNFPEMFQLEGNMMKAEPKMELTRFRRLGPKKLMKCLIEVCPGIVNQDLIVNMDYQLTFLEFYKVLILCARMYLKMEACDALRGGLLEEYRAKMEEYKKQVSEYEKMKESSLPSRKKSRQAEPGKKGRNK